MDVAGIVVSALTKVKPSVTVTVSLVNMALGVNQAQTVSSTDGSFSFSGLPIGTYALMATAASGFNSYTRLRTVTLHACFDLLFTHFKLTLLR